MAVDPNPIFTYLNHITNHTHLEFTEEVEREYTKSQFMILRGLSYYPDTCKQAFEMSCSQNIKGKMQFDFLFNTVTKAKRYSKWFKPEVDKDLAALCELYGYSEKDAASAKVILVMIGKLDDEINRVRKGGRNAK